MNWALVILAAYAAIAALAWGYLVIDELVRRKRISLGGTADALFCALLWPVILGIILCERIGTWRKKNSARRRAGERP